MKFILQIFAIVIFLMFGLFQPVFASAGCAGNCKTNGDCVGVGNNRCVQEQNGCKHCVTLQKSTGQQCVQTNQCTNANKGDRCIDGYCWEIAATGNDMGPTDGQEQEKEEVQPACTLTDNGKVINNPEREGYTRLNVNYGKMLEGVVVVGKCTSLSEQVVGSSDKQKQSTFEVAFLRPDTGILGFIAGVYRFLIALSAFLAGLMIVMNGIKWMFFAAGNTGKIAQAKSGIKSAVLGLLIALFAYNILSWINPALVSLKVPAIDSIVRKEQGYAEFQERSGVTALKEFCPDNAKLEPIGSAGTTTGADSVCGATYRIADKNIAKGYSNETCAGKVCYDGVAAGIYLSGDLKVNKSTLFTCSPLGSDPNRAITNDPTKVYDCIPNVSIPSQYKATCLSTTDDLNNRYAGENNDGRKIILEKTREACNDASTQIKVSSDNVYGCVWRGDFVKTLGNWQNWISLGFSIRDFYYCDLEKL